MLDAIKSEKLKFALMKLPLRTIRGSLQNILGSGDKVKGVIKDLIRKIEKRSQTAFNRWKNYKDQCKKGDLLDAIKSQHLKFALSQVSRRTLRNSLQKLFGEGSNVRGSMQMIISNILKKPKFAFENWKKYIQACKSKTLLDGKRSHQLVAALNKIPKRVLKDASQRILGGGNKVKGAIKTIFESFKSKQRLFIKKWEKYVNNCKEKRFLDSLNSEKLKNFLNSLTKKTIRNSFLIIVGEGDRIKGALKQIIRSIQNRTKGALTK